MKLDRRFNPRAYAASFKHAFEGVLDAYRSQRHMRVHFLFMGLNILLALVYKLSALEVALLMVCITLVVFAEMVNTVIEATLNIVTETYHPITRFAKDVSAGAVLVCAVNACMVGALIYFHPDRLGRVHSAWVARDYVDHSATLRALAMSVMLLFLILVAVKVASRDRTLSGGPISGHTALAFCLATCLAFVVRDQVYGTIGAALAALLAGLVAYLRLHDHSHRIRTVLYGAALGFILPAIVFGLLA